MPTSKNSQANTNSKAGEFDVISSFNYGYRNREDKTNLPPQTLVTGSQNVLTNVYGRISARKGYTLDGAADTSISSIRAAYDYEMHTGDVQHLRAGFLTSAGNDGKLQYRYNDGTTTTWRPLITGLTSTDFNFCDFWDASAVQSRLLMVNGGQIISEWTGGITTLASSTANTLTKAGTETWAETGFYPTGTHTVVVGGVEYGATGGWDTTTLTGVAPATTGTTLVAGLVVHQKPQGTNLSATIGITTAFSVGLIANLKNQVYIASLERNDVYVSKVNSYTDYSYTSPTRVVGEGAILTLDGPVKALVPREDQMNISAGKDQWYKTKFTLSSDLADEELTVQRLKTTSEQAAQSQALVTKIKNNIAFISNEPILESLGWVDNVFGEPQLTDISYPIVNDMNSYDFTDGQVFYHKNFIYVAIPKHSTVLIYNMTNPDNKYWEAPQILPISRFSVIDGDLYGHSYQSSESYKLFDGYNDNGNFINATANLAFDTHGIRHASKSFNQFFLEGYISSNTTLKLGLQYDIDGCATATEFDILGSDTQIVCIGSDDNLLGKHDLGKMPLGANLATSATLPPKFRVIKTFPRVPYYEYQASFSSVGKDQNWEVLAYGAAWQRTFEGNNSITL